MTDQAHADFIRAAIQTHLSDKVEDIGVTHAACAAAASAWIDGEQVFEEALGLAQLLPTPRQLPSPAIFDLASVTKSLVTATLTMQAVDLGLLAWDTTIGSIFEGWRQGGDNGATIMHLLNHSSGLPAWHKFYEEVPFDTSGDALRAQRQEIIARILGWERHPVAGERYAYSDLGYILLCAILEEVFSFHAKQRLDLDQIAKTRIFAPLGMTHTRYVSRLRDELPIADAIATEWCEHRQRYVCGEVHDENTYVMGGVSGHAGAFSTVSDMTRFGRHLLAIDRDELPAGQPPLVSKQSLQHCWSEQARGADGHHLGGWDTPSGERSSVGSCFGRGSTVGHLGFTGTSLWIEREANIVAVLLTNRVHPSREHGKVLDLRIAFHDAVAGARADRG